MFNLIIILGDYNNPITEITLIISNPKVGNYQPLVFGGRSVNVSTAHHTQLNQL